MPDVLASITDAPPPALEIAALKAEGRRRAESDAFFGYMAYASMVGRKSREGRRSS